MEFVFLAKIHFRKSLFLERLVFLVKRQRKVSALGDEFSLKLASSTKKEKFSAELSLFFKKRGRKAKIFGAGSLFPRKQTKKVKNSQNYHTCALYDMRAACGMPCSCATFLLWSGVRGLLSL